MFCQHTQKIKKRHFHTSDTDIPEKQNDQQSHDHKKRNQIAERSVCFCPGIILFSFICDLMFCSSCIATIVIICTSVRSGSLQFLQKPVRSIPFSRQNLIQILDKITGSGRLLVKIASRCVYLSAFTA